ncbi:class-III pyridoxal-phosphate-dependent aminotransferase [Actinomadura sp. 3N407]|uniref:class-III pyridoxal-phosphate-dependent aminotransferase n=1 Tax=Actinomadura sp. 3N407 TaxID=3457423 RepID=UPI003FCCC8A1
MVRSAVRWPTSRQVLSIVFDYGYFAYTSKEDLLDRSARTWNPGKTGAWLADGIDLVIDRREGYFIWDMSGRRLIDVHLNGGTYSLGHLHPELVGALRDAVQRFDVGNHHFPALARTALAEALLATCAPHMSKVVFSSGGGEAIDIAIKSARHATGRSRIVSAVKAFHGHTGLAVAAGDRRFSEPFRASRPEEFTQVPFNDPAAMEQVLARGDVAGVLLETIPATFGFPMPAPGYLETVKRLCETHGALFIIDEVQTGLMRTGEMWAIDKRGVVPDILVTGKGLGGGLYPIGAALLNERASRWLHEDGWGHVSTFGGAELGCVMALTVLDICGRPELRSTVGHIAGSLERGLAEISARHGDFFHGIRQDGLVIGLEFAHPQGGKLVSRALYERGVWAIHATLDPAVLQFKPGLQMSPDLVDELLERLDAAVGAARREATASPYRKAVA